VFSRFWFRALLQWVSDRAARTCCESSLGQQFRRHPQPQPQSALSAGRLGHIAGGTASPPQRRRRS